MGGANLTASNTHFSGNFDSYENNQAYQDDFFYDNEGESHYQGGNNHHNHYHQKHGMGGHSQYGGRGRPYYNRYDDSSNYGYNGGNNHSNHMDRHSHYSGESRGSHFKDDTINFSLNYRHISENNLEQY